MFSGGSVASGTIHTSRFDAVEFRFVKSPTSARSSTRFSSSLWSLYSLIVFRSTSVPMSEADVTSSGVGRSYVTTNCPEVSMHPPAASAASATSGTALRSEIMVGFLSRRVEDRVRGAERDVRHLARRLAVHGGLELAADVERELRDQRDAEPEPEVVRRERLVLSLALEARAADADVRVEHGRDPEREHRIDAVR